MYFDEYVSYVTTDHSKMVVHRELKPDNLMLDSKRNVKTINFDLRNTMHISASCEIECETPHYVALKIESLCNQTGESSI